MKILLDRGHGRETSGKRSPVLDEDVQSAYGVERLYEWAYCDRVAREVKSRLDALGYDAVLVTPEEYDVGLGERVNRVNRYCYIYGAGNCVSVCIHLNAAGSLDTWKDATGYTGWIAMDASTNSYRLAAIFAKHAEALDMMGNRKCGPTIRHNWAMVHLTRCPAILTESAFMDNREQAAWLLSDSGFDKVCTLHVESIVEYINTIS